MSKFQATDLRRQHSVFTFEKFDSQLNNSGDWQTTFFYQLENGPQFTHRVIFEQIDQELLAKQDPSLINKLVFHLGLIESFSYWKLAASPQLTIACGSLNDEQTAFWRNLLIQGMSEYFYRNQLDFTKENFIELSSHGPSWHEASVSIKKHNNRRSLVNLGGGKDSAVMLALLAQNNEDFESLIVKPSSPAADTLAQTSRQAAHFVKRVFDPQLFALNKRGCLNGHVPFSASLAFINLLAGVLYDSDWLLVGNESSSNEPTTHWHGQAINHQYSKSVKFEQSFVKYSRQFLLENVKYFSFLRVFNELQIANIFSTLPEYFSIFRSCNCDQQQNQWCQKCAKCLFVYLMLAPFIDSKIISSKIFDHNLLNDLTLEALLRQLSGLDSHKPFDCVGTREEVGAAVYLITQKYQQNHEALPTLLAKTAPEILSTRDDWSQIVQKLTIAYNSQNTLPQWAARIASDAFREIVLN